MVLRFFAAKSQERLYVFDPKIFIMQPKVALRGVWKTI